MEEANISRKERERQRHRKEIMAAAERVFAEKGYHECSIQDIANAAEFSVGTIYNFFNNKDGLFSSLLKEGKAEMKREVDRRLKELTCPVEKIRAIVACHMETAERHKDMLRLLFDYRKPGGISKQCFIDQDIVDMHMEFLEILCNVFSEAIKQGKIVSHEPRYLAIALDGMLIRFFEHFHILEDVKSYNDITPIIDEIFIKRLLVNPQE